jgi:hypothetical protein
MKRAATPTGLGENGGPLAPPSCGMRKIRREECGADN